MKSIICLWAGAIVDIPAGWHLCDGSTIGLQTLPDLRDKFIMGAGGTYAPDEEATTNLALDTGFTAYTLAYIIKL